MALKVVVRAVLEQFANIFEAIVIFIFIIFLVIVIFKIVIFCKLMILYTQYYPMSVFFVSACYWFHSIPGGSTCKHLS